MLRDNLAGLIAPIGTARKHIDSLAIRKKHKLGDAPGQPTLRSSLISDPRAKFSSGSGLQHAAAENAALLE
jgi:hypothetical protein